MAYLILFISWFLRTYGAVQEKRSPLETPAIVSSDLAKTLLMLLWILLLVFASYLIFSKDGLFALLVSLLLYFILAPIFFGKIFKKLLDKFGF